MLPLVAIFDLKLLQNAFAAGDLRQIPLEELTALLQPRGWFSKGRFAAGRKGERSPTFHTLTTACIA